MVCDVDVMAAVLKLCVGCPGCVVAALKASETFMEVAYML